MKTNALLVILKSNIHDLRNSMLRFGMAPFFKIAIGFVLVSVIISVEYLVAVELFEFVMKQQYLENLRFVLLAKLLYMIFLIFLALLAYSNTVLSISSFFLSPELDVLHARPVSMFSLFTTRFLETFLGASWMFIAFGVPILVAYGRVLGQGAVFFVGLAGVVIPLLLIPSGVGITAGIGLIAIFSPRRTQRVLVLIGVMLAIGLVVLFRWMRPEQLIDPIGVEQMAMYLETLRMPTIEWLPSSWAADAIASMGENRYEQVRPIVIRLFAVAGVSTLISYTMFRCCWWRARSGGQGGLGSRKKTVVRQAGSPSLFKMSLMYRDLIIFIRDPGQWTQMVVLAALFAIYTFNFKNLPYSLYGFTRAMTYVSIAASGLIQAALLARFAFPSISTEGQAIHRLRSTPISWKSYYLVKFLQHLISASLFGIALLGFSLVILDVQGAFFVKSIVLMAEISLISTALALAIGARFPRFDLMDAAQVAVSTGGFVYMFSALSVISLLIFIAAMPDMIQYFSMYSPRMYPYVKRFDAFGSMFAAAVISIVGSLIATKIGLSALHRMNESEMGG